MTPQPYFLYPAYQGLPYVYGADWDGVWAGLAEVWAVVVEVWAVAVAVQEAVREVSE